MGNLTNLYGLPDALVNAVRNDPYTGGGDISVTKLIDSPQKRVLAKQYRDVVVEDVSERIWSLMGQAVHTVLERAQTSALVEKRLYATVDGMTLSGQFDRAHIQDRVLQDWKVCSTYKADGDKGWERQLNVLRWLARENGIEIDRLEVVAIFRDWKKSEALRKDDYPQQAVKTVTVPVWPYETTLEYIRERMDLHKAADSGMAAECSEDERWYSGTTYALMKLGGKRAIRVSPVREELGDPGPGQEIVVRPGANRRCEHYCEVAPFCPQYQRLRETEGTTNDVDF